MKSAAPVKCPNCGQTFAKLRTLKAHRKEGRCMNALEMKTAGWWRDKHSKGWRSE